jgi:hypothetical protein
VREKRSQRQPREGGRRRRRAVDGAAVGRSRLASSPLKTERERREGERRGKNLEGEAGGVVYIWLSGF